MKKSYIYSLVAALLLAVVAFLFFAPDAAVGNVLQQQDIQQGIANGQEGKAFHEATGETTRWTDSLFGGMPNFQIAPSYPSSSLLGWIQSVYTLWLPSPANLLFAMMLGFFIMLLCMKMKWPLALFGALAWGFSTYFIIIIGAGHIWKFVTLAYIPPTIGGIVLIYRKKYLGGTALAALFGALQLNANHPQMSYYFLFVIAAMMIAWLVIAIREKQMKQWCTATLLTIAAGLLAAGANIPSLYNSYEYAKETTRGRATELTDGTMPATPGMSREAITAWSYGIDESFSLLIPNVKGGATIKPVGGRNTLLSVAEAPEADNRNLSGPELQFLSQFPQYFGNQPMTNGPVYVGAFILMLAILAMFVCDGPMKWALFGVSVLALMLSWGHNMPWLTNLFIDHFPAYNKFRTVSSILVILEFTIPLLAVMCLKKIFETPDFFKRYSMQFYCVMGAGMLICLVGWIAPSVFGSAFSVSEVDELSQAGVLNDTQYAPLWRAITDIRMSLVRADSIRSFFFILIGALVLWLYLRGALKNKTLVACMLSVVVIIDLFPVNKRYVNSENFVEPMEADATFTPTAADLAILADKSNYRVLDAGNFGGARSSYFHKTIGGYHAAKLTRYNDLIDRQISKGNPAVLNMLNTKYILDGDRYEMNPEAWGNAWFVDSISYVPGPNEEMLGLDSLKRTCAVADKAFEKTLGTAVPVSAGDTVYETSYAPNKLTYKAKSARGGVAVFSEIFFPWGWTATVDGKETPIGRANYVLRAIRIPAGEHEIVFRFDPKSIRVTNTVSIISIVIIYLLAAGAIALVAMHIIKRKKQKPDEKK